MFRQAVIVAAVTTMIGCSTATVKMPDGSEVPADVYATQLQYDHARIQTSTACDAIERLEVADVPPDTKDYAWAINSIAWSNALAAQSCGQAKEDVAEATKPDSYLKYSLARERARWSIVGQLTGFALQAACMFNAFGACGGNGSSSNLAGDHFENITINQGGSPAGSGGGGGGELADGGSGGAAGDSVINLGGYGNSINSSLSGSVQGYGVSGDAYLGRDFNFGSLQNGDDFNGTFQDQSLEDQPEL